MRTMVPYISPSLVSDFALHMLAQTIQPYVEIKDYDFANRFLTASSQVVGRRGSVIAHYAVAAERLQGVLNSKKSKEGLDAIVCDTQGVGKLWDSAQSLATRGLPSARTKRNKLLISALLATPYAQAIIEQDPSSLTPSYNGNKNKRISIAQEIARKTTYATRADITDNPVSHEMKAAISAIKVNPKVFYFGAQFDLIGSLMATDYSEMIGIGLDKTSFSRFKKIVTLSIAETNARALLPTDQISNLSFSQLTSDRYEVSFTYGGLRRRAVLYQGYNGFDESRPLPEEILNGYDVLYGYGAGMWASTQRISAILRLLDEKRGFIAHMGFFQTTPSIIVTESDEVFLSRFIEFERVPLESASPGTLLRMRGHVEPSVAKLSRKDIDHVEDFLIKGRRGSLRGVVISNTDRLAEIVHAWVSSFR